MEVGERPALELGRGQRGALRFGRGRLVGDGRLRRRLARSRPEARGYADVGCFETSSRSHWTNSGRDSQSALKRSLPAP